MPRVYACFLMTSLMLVIMLFAACDEEKITPYLAPKDPLKPMDVSQSPISFTVPSTWKSETNHSAMLNAAFGTPDGGRVTVSSLTADGGGRLANLNRWREQLGLALLTSLANQNFKTLTIDGQTATVCVLVNDKEQRAMTVASIPVPNQNCTWFIKMTASPSTIQKQSEQFASFLQSIRFNLLTNTTNES